MDSEISIFPQEALGYYPYKAKFCSIAVWAHNPGLEKPLRFPGSSDFCLSPFRIHFILMWIRIRGSTSGKRVLNKKRIPCEINKNPQWDKKNPSKPRHPGCQDTGLFPSLPQLSPPPLSLNGTKLISRSLLLVYFYFFRLNLFSITSFIERSPVLNSCEQFPALHTKNKHFLKRPS